MNMFHGSDRASDQRKGEGNRRHWDSLAASVRRAAIERAYLRPEMVVAEIGPGDGALAAALALLVAKVHQVTGWPAVRQVGAQEPGGCEGGERRLPDAARLPFDDACLDAVFATLDLRSCPDPQVAITEMVRVLRPGGRLMIAHADRRAGPRSDAPARARTAAQTDADAAGRGAGGDRQAIKGWLRAAGLVNVIVDFFGEEPGPAAERRRAEPAVLGGLIATGSRRVSGAADAVRANYSALASEGGCCSSADPASDCCKPPADVVELVDARPSDVVLYDTGYTAEQIAQVPPEAAHLSLGCGNPTAIAGLQPGESVLDIGSGAGIDAFYAARRVGDRGRVIGLDATPAMVERAQRAAQAAGLAQVEFRTGQAEEMPVEDGTIDVVLSNCVINLAEDKGRVFEEACRVLKPGGRLSISDMVTAGPLPSHLRGDPETWAGCINGALPEREYLDLVLQAGFTDVVAQRGPSGGLVAGVEVYSLAVAARKPQT